MQLRFVYFLAVRLLSVFFVQTSFVPDEYWQSLEVAHKVAFGYGYLTWEWTEGIRSWIIPLIFAVQYKFSHVFNADTAYLIVTFPRILQATLTALSEWNYFSAVAAKLGQADGKIAALLNLASWFLFYVGSRTLANTLEVSLVLLGMSQFLKNDLGGCMIFIVVSCYLRPTAGALWLPVVWTVVFSTYRAGRIMDLFKMIVKMLLLVAVLFVVDSYMYGKFLLVPYEFLKFNFFSGMANFYGTQPWHWYWTNALPSVMGVTGIPIVVTLLSVKKLRRYEWDIARLCLVTSGLYIILHSFVAHKEIRFVTPTIPLLNTVAAMSIKRFRGRWKKGFIVALLVTNIPAAAYFGIRHQRGVLDVVNLLRDSITEEDQRILFLMPCHSTPLYSHLHRNVSTRFLTCEPNFRHEDNYIDEADQFYRDPSHWLRENLTEEPQWIVMYDKLQPQITTFLEHRAYKLRRSIFHSDIDEGRVGKRVLVFEKT